MMGERAGSRGTGWNLEHDPSPARTQGRDAFQKRESFAMGEVGCLASISCGSKLPPEHDISNESMHADFSDMLPALLWQKNPSLTIWVVAKIGLPCCSVSISAVEVREESHSIMVWQEEEEKVFNEIRWITEMTSSPDCYKLKVEIMAQKSVGHIR